MNFSFRYPITVFRFSMVFYVFFLCCLASLIIILPVALSSRDVKTTLYTLAVSNSILIFLGLVVFRKELFKYLKTRSHKTYFEIADHGFSLPAIYLFPTSYCLNSTYIPFKNVSGVEILNQQNEINVKFAFDSSEHTLILKPEHFLADEDFHEIENYFRYYSETLNQGE